MEPPPGVAKASLDPAHRVGKYVLLEEIGRGAFAAVHRAWDPTLSRTVALKLLQARDEESRVRFEQEARVAAALVHPNVVPIHEVGSHEGRTFIAMQLIEGRPLAQASLDLRAGLRVVAEAARAVAEAHRRGIVHRDIKPENILVDADGRAYVTDFGLAREVRTTSAMTMKGDVLGTPAFMSPEMARGDVEQVDALSDVFSLGSTLYFVCTKEPPFAGVTAWDTVLQVAQREPPAVREVNPAVPPDVEAIVRRAMSKERAARFPSADALAEALQAHLEGRAPVRARPPRRLLWGVTAAVLLTGAAAYWASRPPPPVRLPVAPPTAAPDGASLDVRVRVIRVADGDTLDVVIDRPTGELSCEGCTERQRRNRPVEGTTQVRLAGGLDAPGRSTPEGDWAIGFLENLFRDADEIWLDIDGLGGPCKEHGHATRDHYCRLLGSLWVRKKGTWTNAGRALLDEGRALYPAHNWLRYKSFPSEVKFEE